MPNERYTYRGLRTDLGKIPSIWSFENSTTVLLVHKVQNLNRQSKIFIKAKTFLTPPLHNKIFVLNHFKNFSEYLICVHCTEQKLLTPRGVLEGPLKLGLIDPK